MVLTRAYAKRGGYQAGRGDGREPLVSAVWAEECSCLLGMPDPHAADAGLGEVAYILRVVPPHGALASALWLLAQLGAKYTRLYAE